MTITRAQAEFSLVKRSWQFMSLAGMAVTYTGSNNDLVDPLLSALRGMGITPASQSEVTDGDLASVSDEQVEEFLNRAQWQLLQNIRGNLTVANVKSGPYSEDYSYVMAFLNKSIEELSKKIESEYANIAAGTIDLNFSTREEDD